MIRRFIWQIAYARIALASRYDFNLFSAWCESASSWAHNADDTPAGCEMLTPTQAFEQDTWEWRLSW